MNQRIIAKIKNNKKSKKIVSFSIDLELLESFRLKCELEQVSQAQVVSELLREFLGLNSGNNSD